MDAQTLLLDLALYDRGDDGTAFVCKTLTDARRVLKQPAVAADLSPESVIAYVTRGAPSPYEIPLEPRPPVRLPAPSGKIVRPVPPPPPPPPAPVLQLPSLPSLKPAADAMPGHPQRYFEPDLATLQAEVALRPSDESLWLQYASVAATQAQAGPRPALGILSQALEALPRSAGVWAAYLSLYTRHASRTDAQDMCLHAAALVPQLAAVWELYVAVLSLCLAFNGANPCWMLDGLVS
jgi:hypothetical protein